MDTSRSREVVSDVVASDKLEQSQKADSTVQETKSTQVGIPGIVCSSNDALDVVASDRLQHNNKSKSQVHEPQSDKEKDISMASLRNGSGSDEHASDETRQNCSSGAVDVTPDDGVPNEVAIDEMKQSSSPELRTHEVRVSQGAVSPAARPGKALEDGYNWRKYGQKNVKGNEFTRSYYKCTHPTCLVKKQVERSHDGQITDTLYFGTHDHLKTQPISVAAGSVSSIQEEKMAKPLAAGTEDESPHAHIQTSHQTESTEIPKPLTLTASETDTRHTDSGSIKTQEEVDNDVHPEPKRLKQDCRNVDATRADKQTRESRIVIRTTSEVDIVNDGYRWRKYGQKLVKGNPNPRSYYRCSNAGCPVKKHVERASHDPKVVIMTYEGEHDHEMPAARTITPNTAGSNTNPTTSNGVSRAESEETDIVGHEVVVQYNLHSKEHCCRPNAAPIRT